MKIQQKKNKNKIVLDFKDGGINYTLIDESINKTEFIPYENIENNSYELFESNKYYKSNAIYLGIVGVLFLSMNIFYGMKLWAWLFIMGSPIFYMLYKKSKTDYKVINVDEQMDIYLIKDKKLEEINSLIYKNRNKYLKENYYEINYDNDKDSEIGKFKWLKNIEVISEREFNVIKEEIMKY